MAKENVLARLIEKLGELSKEDAEMITTLAKKYGVEVEQEAPEPQPQHEAQESQETEETEHKEGQELGEATGEVTETKEEESQENVGGANMTDTAESPNEDQPQLQPQEGKEVQAEVPQPLPQVETQPQVQPIQANFEERLNQFEKNLNARMDEFAKMIAKGLIIEQEVNPLEVGNPGIGARGSHTGVPAVGQDAWTSAVNRYHRGA